MLNYLSRIALLAAIYFATAWVGLRLDAVGGFATLVWAPTGIALAALLIFGFQLWPGIALGAFTVNFLTGAPLLVAMGICAGNTLEAVLGAFLLKRFVNFDNSLSRQKDAIGLIVLAGLLSTLVSATIGVSSLAVGGALPTEKLAATWRAWWMGDIWGDLIVAPLILVWSRWKTCKFPEGKFLEVIGFTIGLVLTSCAVFGVLSSSAMIIVPTFPFLLFPFIVWAALRFGPQGSSAAVFLVATLSILSTTLGVGAFTEGPLNDRLNYIHSFLGVIAFVGLILASATEERKKATEDLRKAKEAAEAANLAKSSFLANMSHEIRTPLGAVMGFSDLVMDQKLSVDDRATFVAAIKRNGELLSNIINDILDLSKVEAGKMQVISREVALSEILLDTKTLLDLQAKIKGLKLNIAIDANVPLTIHTDPLRLRQILNNIIGNAIKFTSIGSIDVYVKYEPTCLTFVVRDSGRGVSEGKQAKLFAPFSQADETTKRKHGGTGLGLVLSKRLANLLGGDVVLTHTSNRGSTFTITINPKLKTTEMADVKAPAHAYSEPTRLNGIKVLLADDSIDNQMLVTQFLELAGAKVDVASNGEEATEKARKENYDVLLMDLQMPVMDGYEATAKLRQEGYRGKIVALTAHALADERERCLANGFDDHLSKPVDRVNLIRRVEAIAR